MKSHLDLNVWKESIKLVKEIYIITKCFPKEELYGLTNQIRRAVVSVPSNIAEGAARKSNKEFSQFLSISLGSLAEVETQLIISKELDYIQDIVEPSDKVNSIRRMLIGLMRVVNK